MKLADIQEPATREYRPNIEMQKRRLFVPTSMMSCPKVTAFVYCARLAPSRICCFFNHALAHHVIHRGLRSGSLH